MDASSPADAADASRAYAELLRALAADPGASARLSARQREAVERLSRPPVRESKAAAEPRDPLAECTFRPRINARRDGKAGATEACARLYAQGRERDERRARRAEEARRLDEAREAREAPTFRPALVTGTRRRAELQRDVFSSLYGDAARLARRRDALDARPPADFDFRPRLCGAARPDLVRSIVDQLSRFT